MDTISLNIFPIVVIIAIILAVVLAIVITYLVFFDKKDTREHDLHILIENNRTDIIKKYTGEDGKLDQEHMLMDLAIQNQMIIDTLEKLKKMV